LDEGLGLTMTKEMFAESTAGLGLWKNTCRSRAFFIFTKTNAAFEMSPLAGFLAGILRSPGAYLLTHNNSFFLLPVHYTYKRLAWFFGFFDAHLNGYGHKLSHNPLYS
jgi:hypothetical protein